MSCAHMALIDGTKIRLEAGDDADNAQWFKVSLRLLDEHVEYCRDAGFWTGKADPHPALWNWSWHAGRSGLSASLRSGSASRNTRRRRSAGYCENDGLAFDHAKIIVAALERLRGKLEYTDLALHLMPEEFTLTQLQQVYEVIWDKSLLKAAFRRKVASMVQETDSYTKNEGHRPSRLYRRRWEE